MNDYYEKDYESHYKKPKKRVKKVSTRLLTIIQITVCSVIIVTAILIRIFGGNAYSIIKNWYWQNINNSIVAQEQIENVKHSVFELLPWTSSSAPSAVSSQLSSSQSTSQNSQQNSNPQSNISSQQKTDSIQAKG